MREEDRTVEWNDDETDSQDDDFLLEGDDEDEPNGVLLSEKELIEKYASGQLRIVRSTMDFTLHNLRQVISDKSYLNISPSYQRRNRWDRRKRSLLIESFLLNIPVPPIYLYERDYNSYEVMDGLQRLQTINDFIDNKFRLIGLEFWSELNGKKYDELPDVLRKGLLRRTLSAIVLLAESSRPEDSDVDVRMVLFRRLNTGGIQLNAQELRNALYPGHFNDMLLRVSRSSIFTDIWGIPPRTIDEDENPPERLLRNRLYRTMGDCEIVLRFFAIRETIVGDLKGGFRRLLDTCMVRHQKDSITAVDSLEELFNHCITGLRDIFEGQPFILPRTNRPSLPLFDALMVAYSLVSNTEEISKDYQAVQERLMTYAMDEDNYAILTGKGNTTSAIKERVSLAKKILVGDSQ
ncbi:DUF262 domain-containing protein [Alicyclobacillus curvatus]|nr:DUF262 domain-containing protein [Alicyclobacillus curvatus]